MIRRPPRSTLSSSSAASDVYKRQTFGISNVVLSERPMNQHGMRRKRGAQGRFADRISSDCSRRSVMERYWEETQPLVGGELAETQCVWAVSDLHTECSENMEWLRALPCCNMDTLVVAGNIATDMKVLESSLSLLVDKFQHVFYVPGNRELWLDGSSRCEESAGSSDSGSKFFEILSMCDRLGVRTTPQFVGKLLICPLFSWYKVGEEGLGLGQPLPVSGDLQAIDVKCAWPDYLSAQDSLHPQIADFFADLNQRSRDAVMIHPEIDEYSVISFSHFLPYKELFPGVIVMRHVMGCDRIARQVSGLASQVHVFGHSCINMDRMIHNTRFLQAALGQPSDGTLAATRNGPHEPALVWDCHAEGAAVLFDGLAGGSWSEASPMASPAGVAVGSATGSKLGNAKCY
eukprot:TRINITY_DN12330_c0_g1_i7.p1 TRINITY_DN12330_c0_g1~~TRINITY_DN12330_c0_g1_i7.p1  ORF type:complete len:404 (+),score=68.62 TRINITY_DN12330_c0_g1_i7:88-1299(+)